MCGTHAYVRICVKMVVHLASLGVGVQMGRVGSPMIEPKSYVYWALLNFTHAKIRSIGHGYITIDFSKLYIGKMTDKDVFLIINIRQ